MANRGRYLAAAVVGVSWSAMAVGADANSGSDLEQITVYAPQPNGTSLGGTTITQADLQQFNRDTLDTAIVLSEAGRDRTIHRSTSPRPRVRIGG
jgi:hypothetical protein